MTTQAVQATLSNARLGKIFTKTATDDVWDGNTLTDSLSDQQLGILMPSVPITHVQATYTAGCMAWRIQNSANLTFQRYGFGVPDGFSCYASQRITPYTVNPNDIFTVYPLPAAGVGEANTLAWVVTTKGVELFEANAATSGTATAMKTVVNQQTLGDSMFNSTLQSIHVQAQDGATVDSIEIIDNSGGVVTTLYGSVRGASSGAMSLDYNLKVDGLAVPIGKGFSLRVTTTTA